MRDAEAAYLVDEARLPEIKVAGALPASQNVTAIGHNPDKLNAKGQTPLSRLD